MEASIVKDRWNYGLREPVGNQPFGDTDIVLLRTTRFCSDSIFYHQGTGPQLGVPRVIESQL